jgi:hypothetical protein
MEAARQKSMMFLDTPPGRPSEPVKHNHKVAGKAVFVQGQIGVSTQYCAAELYSLIRSSPGLVIVQ